MDKLLEELMGFLKSVADRSGVKFLIALAGIASLWHLISIDKIPGVYGSVCIVLVVIGFFIFRHFEKINGGMK